jgi:Fuc2NAc and GlcNAc transferase
MGIMISKFFLSIYFMNNLLFFSFMVVASFLLTELIRRYTLNKNLIDTPNERSSHTVPTPRGGGLSIVVIFLIAISFVDSLPTDIFMALMGSGGG